MKQKIYYRILRNDFEVTTFSENYSTLQNTFPGIEATMRELIDKARTNTRISTQDVLDYQTKIKETIQKQYGIAKSSLNYYKHHKADGLSMLSQDAVRKLEQVFDSSKNELDILEFLVEGLRDYRDLSIRPDCLSDLDDDEVSCTENEME